MLGLDDFEVEGAVLHLVLPEILGGEDGGRGRQQSEYE
jgi:hypothetical protein